VPDSATDPLPIPIIAASLRPITALCTHVFPVIFVIVIAPCLTAAAFAARSIPKPAVLRVTDTAFGSARLALPPKYPLVTIEPSPTCTNMMLVPFVLTPWNIIVIRFTQLGIPVKSMLVPLVDATEVPKVIDAPAIVAEPSVLVTILLVAELVFLTLVTINVLMVLYPDYLV
jgi:hypothetical protein